MVKSHIYDMLFKLHQIVLHTRRKSEKLRQSPFSTKKNFPIIHFRVSCLVYTKLCRIQIVKREKLHQSLLRQNYAQLCIVQCQYDVGNLQSRT